MQTTPAGKFAAEIVPVPVPQRKGDPVLVDTDEGPRADTTAAALAKLKPAFKRDGGTVTAGNASTINDGAAAVLVCSESFAREHGLPAIAVVEAYGTGAVDPEWVMMAPVGAVRKLLENAKVTRFLKTHQPEMLAEFETIAATEGL